MTMRRGSYYVSDQARTDVHAAYEAVLGSWPLPLERHYLPTSFGPSFALAFGPTWPKEGSASPPPLVLLHGAQSNSSMWIGDAPVLAAERRVYAVDLPGELGYSPETRLPYDDDSFAVWLGEVLTGIEGLEATAIVEGATIGEGGGKAADRGRARAERPCLCGLSLGAWVALSFAVRQPSRLSALALLCPSGLARPRRSFLFKALLASIRGNRGMARLAASLYGDRPAPEEALRIGALLAVSVRPRIEEPRLFSDAELARLDLPLLLIVGEKDVMLDSQASARRLASLLPRAKIDLVPGAGHALVGMGEELAAFFKESGLEHRDGPSLPR
jgi:pimeloyl-ACP methyl ester carboxylesterase